MGEPVRRAHRSSASQKIGFWTGLVVSLTIFLTAGISGDTATIARMAAIAALMAIWWITDAIPLAATSLLPLVLFPLLGIMSGKDVAPVYTNYIIFLFLGGFLIALAMEKWNLHRRIALAIIAKTGTRPDRLVLGFMLATAFLSMWISNTATAIMMLAIGLAVLRQAEDTFGSERCGNLCVSLLLGIAYAASIGGLATLVGTPPNLALVRIYELSFPAVVESGESISFGQWMIFGVPLTIVLLLAAWFVLVKIVFRPAAGLELPREAIRSEKAKLGRMSREERAIACVFVATALLWIFRGDLNLGSFTLPGWSDLLPFGDMIDDGTIAIAMALLLFILPGRPSPVEEGPATGAILDASVLPKVPWGIILLFGGGFALAKGFQTSGLSEWFGGQFAELESAPVWIVVGVVTTGITFLTELTSNTATTEMILPLLAAVATAAKIHPLLLMVPAAVAASCAFMMPVATPPNAIVFGSGRITVAQMAKAGILLNLVAIVVVTTLFLLIGPAVFGTGEPLPAAQP